MSNRFFLDVISGENQSIVARLIRPLLSLGSLGYGAVTSVRNWLYHGRLVAIHAADLPVISIGNITTGGTGKTPTVGWVVNWLAQHGARPAIVSRGYRSLEEGENDEKRLLDSICPGVPHYQNKNRAEAIRALRTQTSSNVVVLDDGFQHRKLHRDLDVILIDAINPWGHGHLLPRGLLREHLKNLSRADVILLTRCELAADAELEKIQQQLKQYTKAPILKTTFQPTHLVNSLGDTLPLTAAAHRSLIAFCGIGNPKAFRRTLVSLAIAVPEKRLITFPDHHHYSHQDLKNLSDTASEFSTEMFIATRKDLVKINAPKIGRVPLWALEISLVFQDSEQALTDRLQEIINKTHSVNKTHHVTS